MAVQRRVEAAYDAAVLHLGDRRPDFMAAVHDLTQAGCTRLNAEIGDAALLEAGARAAAMASPNPFAGIVCRSFSGCV